MAENNQQPPQMDLEQILKTLAGLPPLPSVQQQDQQFQYDPSSIPTQVWSAPAIPPIPTPDSYNHVQDPRLKGRSFPQHHPPPQKPQVPSKAINPPIDPSTITEWKQGLRCVSKIAQHNPTFEACIQKMIKDQEQNTRNWENGRIRLIEEQKAKRENEQKQRAAISLPVFLDNTALLRTPEQDQVELDRYHQKVYRACRLMTESHSAELKRLGVPFFGIKQELVLPDDDEPNTVSMNVDTQPTGRNGEITKQQLLTLQRKMLNHLVELYGD